VGIALEGTGVGAQGSVRYWGVQGAVHVSGIALEREMRQYAICYWSRGAGCGEHWYALGLGTAGLLSY
jgi:hypothetical protein